MKFIIVLTLCITYDIMFITSIIIPYTTTNNNIISSTYSEGSTFNNGDAFSSAFAKNKYTSPLGIAMKNAEISPHINSNSPFQYPSKIESADELPTVSEYYNGEHNLNVIKVNCTIYNKHICYTMSSCGWCGSLNKCIHGNEQIPYEPLCVKSTYIYSIKSHSNFLVN